MAFADELKLFSSKAWDLYVEHPFFVALGCGELSRESFRFWLEQDLPYVSEYQRVRNMLADALADDRRYTDLLPRIDASWRTLPGIQETSFEAEMLKLIGVEPPRLDRFSARRSRDGYINHIARIAGSGSVAEISAAMLPCEWGFTEMGHRLGRSRPADLDPVYSKWIDFYVMDEQARNTEVSLAVLERAAQLASPVERDDCRLVFLHSVRHQILVLDAAWRTSDPWPDETRTEVVARARQVTSTPAGC